MRLWPRCRALSPGKGLRCYKGWHPWTRDHEADEPGYGPFTFWVYGCLWCELGYEPCPVHGDQP